MWLLTRPGEVPCCSPGLLRVLPLSPMRTRKDLLTHFTAVTTGQKSSVLKEAEERLGVYNPYLARM